MSEKYPEFPKIPRFNRDVVITEKIDGTNAQVSIEIANDGPTAADGVAVVVNHPLDGDTTFWVRAGSRTRWITPEQDNHGFAKWVYDNASELVKLGPGQHYGEWWGSGINRGYGLEKGEKRFSLFNVGRWAGKLPTGIVSTVPVLKRVPGEDMHALNWIISGVLDGLTVLGSSAAGGFMNPEGIVIYHSAARQMFKITLDGDQPKSEFKGIPNSPPVPKSLAA